MKEAMFFHVVLVCFCMTAQTRAVKVLILPQNMNSHISTHAKMARLLADEGHVVDILMPSNAKVPDVISGSRVNILWHKVKRSIPFSNTEEASKLIVDYIMADSIIEQLKARMILMTAIMDSWNEECEVLLEDNEVRKRLLDGKYDIAIADVVTFNCHVSFLYEMKVPFILYGIRFLDWTLRIPSLPSFVPSPMLRLGHSMTFYDRLLNTVMYFMNHAFFVVTHNTPVPKTQPPVAMMDIFSRCDIYFALDDISIAYPRPTMPNVIYVGDSIPQPGKALPPHLAQFVDTAPDGVIIVSFGSYFDYIPSEVAAKLCSAFKRIPQKVIWKLKNKTLCDADRSKVLTLDWLPQNDLLSHHNVRLFISHCGMNSILESIYHSTPIIGFPSGIDQPYNARRLANKGLGYEMNMKDFTVEELVNKIAQILMDETILANVQRASTMMRDKPDRPEKRITYWLEHVVKYGSGHLKSKAFELNTFQFYCLDVLLVIFCMLALTVAILLFCLRAIILKVKKCFSRKPKVD